MQGVSVNQNQKKRPPGRPRVGATLVGVRIPPDQLAALDAWIRRQKTKPSRGEAIRQMISQALQLTPVNDAAASSRRKLAGKPASAKLAARRDAKLAARAATAASKRPAGRPR
jgi:hypothetical protein